ncbi:TetR/AcrR family transcriptional regulator [Parendozoicomonas sp. Alg238-R29]|uniref:TetR/AcrR family transcriptional regulator n=1 Tax=Parendozoicomonas sp. Alg238-R29 TaxID=2993446 RepID=UPI00248E8029|nr:TetR/AcrR family transcriptional regulator [Parendozoicomonas sp. Alg238-R29]
MTLSNEKEKSILSAALQLFCEHGFHSSPTSKIAALAGVSNGTLLHDYKNKDSLILALYLDIKEHFIICC